MKKTKEVVEPNPFDFLTTEFENLLVAVKELEEDTATFAEHQEILSKHTKEVNGVLKLTEEGELLAKGFKPIDPNYIPKVHALVQRRFYFSGIYNAYLRLFPNIQELLPAEYVKALTSIEDTVVTIKTFMEKNGEDREAFVKGLVQNG